MPTQLNAEERARRLGNVARILIDLARRHAAEEAAQAAQAETRPAGDNLVTVTRSSST